MRKTFTGADRDIALADIKLGLKIYQEMMEAAKMPAIRANQEFKTKISNLAYEIRNADLRDIREAEFQLKVLKDSVKFAEKRLDE